MNPIINLQDTSIAFRENLVLSSVSLKIYEGQLVAIAGPNGAGKTTLLTAINGLARISTGTQSVFGLRLSRRTQNAIRKDIGYVPQMLNIDPRMPMSVKDVVMLGRFGRIGLLKKISSEDEDIVNEAVDLTGMRSLIHRPAGQLSGGEQKKLSIARALAQQPRIMLLDEPLANLDINAQASILRLIDRIHREKKLTTLLVMHQLDLLPKGCSRMILLKNAEIIFDGSVEDALREDVLSKLYQCRVEIIKNHYGVIVRAREKGN